MLLEFVIVPLCLVTEWLDYVNVQVGVAGEEVPKTLPSYVKVLARVLGAEIPVTNAKYWQNFARIL